MIHAIIDIFRAVRRLINNFVLQRLRAQGPHPLGGRSRKSGRCMSVCGYSPGVVVPLFLQSAVILGILFMCIDRLGLECIAHPKPQYQLLNRLVTDGDIAVGLHFGFSHTSIASQSSTSHLSAPQSFSSWNCTFWSS